ncbi:MAG: response regulator [Candidatus Moduliflexus flocculans]|nr:response regulator [Candidatus Moduliflexus flocculans]
MVDDNSTSREILQEMLESFSFEVTLAASGEEGLAEFEKSVAGRGYDLVVMDWKMPGIDGIETARRIKALAGLSRTPPHHPGDRLRPGGDHAPGGDSRAWTGF